MRRIAAACIWNPIHLSTVTLPAWQGSTQISSTNRLAITTLRPSCFATSPERVQFKSVFISYGGPDEPFAHALHMELQRRGVRTFFFPVHAPPGQKLHKMMTSNIGRADRVILLCSRSSLNRPGVQNEIEETLAREARRGGEACLLPVRLDDYVLRGWHPRNAGLAQAIRDRVIANFEGVGTRGRAFREAVARVVGAL
jgi:hypothetical protein